MKNVIAWILLFSFPLSMVAQTAGTQPADTSKTETVDETEIILADNGDAGTAASDENKTYDEGYFDGQTAGRHQPTTFWMAAGCGGGFLFGCLGAGGVWLLANSSAEFPPYTPNGSTEYKNGYTVGYQEGTRSGKASNACIGGIVGMLALTAVAVIYYAGQE